MLNPLREASQLGQSIWYDNIRRSLLTSGELKRMVDEDGLAGVTSNPAIFEKAIAGTSDYDAALQAIQKEHDTDAKTIYERLAMADIQQATDVMHPVFDRTQRLDGYVSLEVSPHLAHDLPGTLTEARRLWKAVGRENLLIKVPATPAGLTAIATLIGEGINVNVTLIFSAEVYLQVTDAYLSGLETLAGKGKDLSRVASVASVFVSRIDTLADAMIEEKIKNTNDPERKAALSKLLGQVAIANAKITYQRFHKVFSGPRWQALSRKGARVQRPLWASTSTKNPAYRDVRYVEELLGPETVNTVPDATYKAFKDHGRPRSSLVENVAYAEDIMNALEKAGISFREMDARLQKEGVQLFADAFDKLLSTVEAKRRLAQTNPLNRLQCMLPKDLGEKVKDALEDWRTTGKMRRLWAGDKTVWTSRDEDQWLGWLTITEQQLAQRDQFAKVAAEVKAAGFTHIVLLGMGGSSLCPEVMSLTFGPIPGMPVLYIVDSTDPQQIAAVEAKVNLEKTLFFVSSKSGSTLEPNIYCAYFLDRMIQTVGIEKAGQHFIAITDPGSKMVEVAKQTGFRSVYYGLKTIGGRYSALSNFGMVPSAAMGVDVPKFLERAAVMSRACAACVPPADNPGAMLGLILGMAANNGRDKLTLIASPGIRDLGAWLEQLIAESTGKQGEAIIPVDIEPLGKPEVYGQDRLFAYLRLDHEPDSAQDAAVEALEKAGQPVVRISLGERYDLAQEFFRWEIATAVAGAVIEINPFDQPDVEAAKVVARALTNEYEKNGSLPPESHFWEAEGIQLFSDPHNVEALTKAAAADQSLSGLIQAHLNRLGAGDYFCLSAFIEMNPRHEELLQELRLAVRDQKKNATCLGFGPRFLHSTGQAYKGGPNTGVFLQITCDDAQDLPVPGQKYTFGVAKSAQARGDFTVLCERRRRALRVHLGQDVSAGLKTLLSAVKKAV